MSASNEIIGNLLQCGVFFWDASENQEYVVSENFRDFLGISSCKLTQKDLETFVDRSFAEFMSPVNHVRQTKLIAPLHIKGEDIYLQFDRTARYTDAQGKQHSAGTACLADMDAPISDSDQQTNDTEKFNSSIQKTLRSTGYDELGIYEHIANLTRAFRTQLQPGMMLSVWKRFDGDNYYCVATEGSRPNVPSHRAVKPGTKVNSPLFSHVCDRFGIKIMVDINSYDTDWAADRKFLLEAGCRSALATSVRPMTSDMAWGFIGLTVEKPRVWTTTEKQWLRLLADSLGTLLAQFFSNEQLRKQIQMTRLACEVGGITMWRRDLLNKKRYLVSGQGQEEEVNYELFIHRKDIGRYEEALKKFLRTDNSEETVYTALRLRMRLTEDADYRWYDINSRVLTRDSEGRPTTTISAAYDVDEQTRRELNEKKEADLRNSIYDNIPAAVTFCNPKGEIVYANNTSVEMFGLRRKEDIYGVSIFKDPLTTEQQKMAIRTQDSFEIVINYDFQKLTTLSYFRSTRKDTAEINIRISKLYNGDNMTGYMLVTIDSTKMTFQQRVLDFFSILLKDVSHFAKLGICRFGNNSFATDQWNINLGVPHDSLPSDDIEAYTNIEETDRTALAADFDKMQNGSMDAFQRDVRVNLQDGVHWISMYFTKLSDKDIFTAISMDVTENKENQLMLVKARDKAEHTEMLKSHFLSNVSHELRTPLNAIIGFSELIVQRNPDPEMKRYSSIIKNNNEHLLRLVDSIMEMSQLQTGNKSLIREMVDIDTLWTHIYERQRNKATAEVQFVCAHDAEHRGVSAYLDQVAVSQIIDNLLGNAFKFTTSGCVMMWLEITPTEISFHVSDTGCGIPEEQQDRIFDTFVKLDSFTIGTGLGLAISQSLAKQMGGKVKVESTLGKGSHFWLEIPLLKSKDELDEIMSRKNVIVLGRDYDTVTPSHTLLENCNVIRCRCDTYTSLWLEHRPKLTIIDARVCPDVATILVKNTRQNGPEYKIVVYNDSVCGVKTEALKEAGADDIIEMPASRMTIDKTISKYIKGIVRPLQPEKTEDQQHDDTAEQGLSAG